MQTKVLEGSKQQIARQVLETQGEVIGAVIFVGDAADRANGLANALDFEQELDAIMAGGSANTLPADVSRESIYSPDQL